jgi:hypothetical protein
MSKVEERIAELRGVCYGTIAPQNTQGATFEIMVEMVRQQAKTNELLEKILEEVEVI